MERKEAAQKVREEIDVLIERDVLIVVEGLKDERSLRSLGVKKVMVLKGPLFSVVERLVGEDEVVILTDLDAQGRKLFSILKRDAQRLGVRVNE